MAGILDKETIKELIESDRDIAIQILSEHPACANRLHVNRQTWEYCWYTALGVSPEQLKQQREEEDAENAIPVENLKRIAEIQQTDAFKNRNHPKHRQTHKQWLTLHMGNNNGNGEKE